MLYDRKWDQPWRALLLRAADFLERHQLHKGSLKNGEGGFCMRGALMWCDGAPTVLAFAGCGPEVRMASAAVASYVGHPKSSDVAFKWNDHPARTKEEVVAAMRAAALAEAPVE
jgi:hypothetical protein